MKVAYKDDYYNVLCKMVGLITANGNLVDFMHNNLKDLSDEQMAEYTR